MLFRSSEGRRIYPYPEYIQYLKWAFSEVIIHAQKESPRIKRYYERLQSKHGKGKAKSIIAHKFAVAIYYMLKNGKALSLVCI